MMTKNYSLMFAIIILITTGIISSSCQTKDISVFSDECEAPCWRRIQPGKTTEIEVMNLLIGFSDIQGNGIRRSDSAPRDQYIAFDLSNGTNVTIYSVDKVVVLILFDNPNGIASFSDCIQKFDIPEYVVQSSVMGFGLPVGATSAWHTWFYALNTKKGTAYGYDTYSYFGKNTDLTPKAKVTVVDFYDTNSYETLLAEGLLVNKEVSEEFPIENLYPWAGYGNIDKLYPKK